MTTSSTPPLTVAQLIEAAATSRNPVVAAAVADLAAEHYDTGLSHLLVEATSAAMYTGTDVDLPEYVLRAPQWQRAEAHDLLVQLYLAISVYDHPRQSG